ncbi:D-alanyl-D-alanine carboxypeptidase family protein [Spirulina sp. CS-785/01]|uniref:M15 family metallopeptidase n=1 Tax=Spirulina sp. CS-785/01 TaxID=3021716 RepID=UPI00232E2E2B|nr:M15 family metallopeptidase [Spirulina sp. CS-785/01]MDB9311850.1 D-alanyl-D-alanine carboxypeptidase family protein [Spirulina sp. CS-785/01]
MDGSRSVGVNALSKAGNPKDIDPHGLDNEEIPVALRDYSGSNFRYPWLLLASLGVAVSGAAAVGYGIFFNPAMQSASQPEPETEATAQAEMVQEIEPAETVENVLGHLPYGEAEEGELVPITADGRIRLRDAAAEEYLAMVDAARRDGIRLATLSGYRTVTEQEYLFFEVKEQRNQEASQRAEVSAPPGYSEHHTGYAVDIGDATVPSTHLTIAFEKTAAFRWLQNNAARFSFELSFPRDNPQGIQYEPWHWRYVGDVDSLETFYRAQHLPERGTENSELETEAE